MIVTALVFLLILSVLVLIHEAGHYFMAKKFGIKVEEFGFGFPLTPPLWQKKKGETVYSLYPLLIGGFVKVYGEDEAGSGKISGKNEAASKKDPDLKRAFFARPVWQRAVVVGAGVVMNTLLAIIIFYAFLGMSGFKAELPLLGNYTFFGVNQTKVTQVIVSDVSPNSPAANAGVKPLSEVISINGTKMNDIDAFSSTIKKNAGNPMTLTWKEYQNNKVHTVTVIPRTNPPKGQGALGIQFYPNNKVMLSYDTPSQRAFSGVIHPLNLMGYNFVVIGSMIGQSVQEKDITRVSDGVNGPIGIFVVLDMMMNIPQLKERFLEILNIAGLLSISLAFFNILPIPGLDGGRLFFILLEGVLRKKIDPKLEGNIHAIGMMFLLLLILLVTVKDVMQFGKYFTKLLGL